MIRFIQALKLEFKKKWLFQPLGVVNVFVALPNNLFIDFFMHHCILMAGLSKTFRSAGTE